MKTTAYLVVHLDTSASPPVVTAVGVYSESARSLTGGIGHDAFAFDALEAAGDDFESARANVLEHAKAWGCFGWALGLLEGDAE